MIRRLYSWWMGIKIGQYRYVKGCPFVIGNFNHLAPVGCWREEDKEAMRFNIRKQEWDGFNWISRPGMNVSMEEFNRLVEECKNQ